MTPGRAALVGLMHRYLGGLLDPFVTLLEVHKLMYFMQEAGEPLASYQKAPYGPYAENLRHVLRAVEGHFVSGYADGGDAPGQAAITRPGRGGGRPRLPQEDAAARAALSTASRIWWKASRLRSVWNCCPRSTGSPRTRARGPSRDLTKRTYEWNERKKRFSERQVALAARCSLAQGLDFWRHSGSLSPCYRSPGTGWPHPSWKSRPLPTS